MTVISDYSHSITHQKHTYFSRMLSYNYSRSIRNKHQNPQRTKDQTHQKQTENWAWKHKPKFVIRQNATRISRRKENRMMLRIISFISRVQFSGDWPSTPLSRLCLLRPKEIIYPPSSEGRRKHVVSHHSFVVRPHPLW